MGDREIERSRVDSLEDLYRLRYDPMVRLAVLLLGTEATAEEVVQDCFIRVGRRWEKVDHPVAYLRVAVVNACRSQRRRAGLERAHYDAAREDVELGADEVWDALAGLPYRQRAALVLRFYEDAPDEEIADALGCRPATVRSLIHRGLAHLRGVIER